MYFEEYQEMPARSTLYQGFNLSAWIKTQRVTHNKNTISPERVATLEAVPGWSWHPRTAAWDEAYNLLRSYVEEHAKIPVGSTLYQGFNLGAWIKTQRVTHNKNTISPERVTTLEAVPGWSWGTLSTAWGEAFNLLRVYVEEHEKMPVRSTIYQGFNLGVWAKTQRVTHNKNTISPERQALLESIPGW